MNSPSESACGGYRSGVDTGIFPLADQEGLPLSPMKLLYFAPHQAWPVNSGARLRDNHLSRQLAARCSVTFAEMRHAGEAWCKLPELSGLVSVITLDKGRTYSTSRIVRGLAGPVPVTVLNCWSRRSAAELARALLTFQFDTVQIEGVHLMEYLPVIGNAPGRPAIVVDWHNIESEMMWRYAGTPVNGLKKMAAKRTAKLIERAEDRLLGAPVIHTVTSERERQKLVARRPGANIQVIPNGVDSGYYARSQMPNSPAQNAEDSSKRTIVFVGSMDYHANIDAVTRFARDAWPTIVGKHPNLQFVIVGRDPAPAIRSPASDSIRVTGTGDDVRPFYASAVAAVVPIHSGSGTRLKILEAMAAGVPVVYKRLGAEGIDVEHDVHILLAESGPEIAAAVDRIVSSPETRNRLSAAARALVVERYDWSAIGKRLFTIHQNLVQARGQSPSAPGY